MAGWHLFTCLNATLFNRLSLDSHLYVHLAESELMYLFFGIALYVFIANTKTPIERFYDIICIGAIIQMTLCYIQWMGHYPVMNAAKYVGFPMKMRMNVAPLVFGSMQNPNFVATILVVSFPFFLRETAVRWRLALSKLGLGWPDEIIQFRIHWAIFIPAILILVAKLDTSTAIIALAVGMLLWLKNPFYIAGTIGAGIGFVYLLDATPMQDSPRWGYWATVARHPTQTTLRFLFGYGPGRYLDGQWYYLHNDWIQSIWFELGWTGVTLLGSYVLSTFALLKTHKIMVSAFIIACICGLGSYPIRLAPSGYLMVMIMALMQRAQYGRLSDI